jgi:phosphonate transport system substrate-binding protein
MRVRHILSIVLLLAGCSPSAAGPAAGSALEAARTLRFTAIPDQNATELRHKFDPVAAYLSRALGVPVEYVPAADYQASVEMFRNGDIQLAWFGGLTGVQARHAVPGAEVIAQGAEDQTFASYFIAHAKTGLTRSDAFPTGILGRTFTFGSASSTSGRLMPEHFLLEATGKAPAEAFRSVSFSGSHDKTAEMVASGAVEVGVLNHMVYDQRVAARTTDPEVARIVWRTPEYADYNFSAHPDAERILGAGGIQRLQSALLAMRDPALLAAFPRSALIAARDAEFDGIRAVALKLGMLR